MKWVICTVIGLLVSMSVYADQSVRVDCTSSTGPVFTTVQGATNYAKVLCGQCNGEVISCKNEAKSYTQPNCWVSNVTTVQGDGGPYYDATATGYFYCIWP